MYARDQNDCDEARVSDTVYCTSLFVIGLSTIRLRKYDYKDWQICFVPL